MQKRTSKQIAGDDAEILTMTGGQKLTMEPGFDFYTQVGFAPVSGSYGY